jgi:hypothetical protein
MVLVGHLELAAVVAVEELALLVDLVVQVLLLLRQFLVPTQT